MDANWFEAVLKKKEYDNSVLRVVKVEEEEAVPAGVNYASIIKRVKLTVVLGSGRTVTKTAILKKAHTGIKSDVFAEFNVFKIETKMYRDVLSHMEILLEEFNDKREKMWCNMLGYTPYTVILFSDLKNEGFTMADRKLALDENHAHLVLKYLGKFHAMSKILLERRIINDNDTNKFFLECDTNVVEFMVKGGLMNFSKIIKESWPAEWSYLAERIAAQIEVAQTKLKALLQEPSDFIVLNHGDCWTCNIMFKYDDSGNNPTSLRFLDFQVSHVNSFIWDVVYFLYTSVKNDVRQKHLTDFYKVYWNSLTSNLKFFGYDGITPTFEDLLKEAERIDYFAFFVFSVIRPIMISKSDKPFDLEKLGNRDEAVNAIQMSTVDSLMDDSVEFLKSLVDRGVI